MSHTYGGVPEERPLFGEEKPQVKFAVWGCVFVLAVIVVFSATVGIVFGVLHKVPQHIMLAGCLLCLCVLQAILFRWYRMGELDPKFLWLLIGFAIVTILICVTINAYVWPKPDKCEKQPTCEGGALWDPEKRQCLLRGIFDCGASGMCVQASRSQLEAQCCNCTMSTCSAPGPPVPLFTRNAGIEYMHAWHVPPKGPPAQRPAK